MAWAQPRRGLLAAGLALLLAGGTAGSARAGALPAPTGKVVLTVTGKIANGNAEGRAELDRDLLERIGLVDLVTSTPHTEGKPRWRGVRLSVLLRALGAEGRAVKAMAVNDYSVVIPIEDIRDYDPIVALDRDGKAMRIRDKGPGWVIYPWDQFPELANEIVAARSIWQLRELHIE